MDTRIIRLSDGNTVWMSSSSAHLLIEELPFYISSSNSKFISVSLDQKKAVIFPFEVFRVLAEDYYFGPVPAKFQIVRSTAISWLTSPIFSGTHRSDMPTAKQNLTGRHSPGKASFLRFICFAVFFLFAIFYFSKNSARKINYSATRSARRITKFIFVLVSAIPVTAIAPELDLHFLQEVKNQGASIAFAKSLPTLAKQRKSIDQNEALELEESKITSTQTHQKADNNFVKHQELDSNKKPEKVKIKQTQFKHRSKQLNAAGALEICANLNELTALISDSELISIQEKCKSEKK